MRVARPRPVSGFWQISGENAGMEPYTVALTSCGRFDLLEQTLRTLLPRLDGPLAGVLVAEDSGNRGVLDVVRQFTGQFGKIEAIVNDPPLGHVKSIDRLYSRVGTEWIFHCEDDWEFFADGFIEKSFIVLKEFDRFSMVSVRDPAELQPDLFLPGPLSFSGVRYFAMNPSVSPVTGLSFNPGLRRMRDYKIVGPYRDLGIKAVEYYVSACYRQLGFSIAHLADPAVRHIGEGRHVRDHVKPTSVGGKIAVEVKKGLERLRRTFHPEGDPIRRAERRLEEAKAGKRRTS